MSKVDCTAEILSNIEVAKSHFQMTMECPEIAAIVAPGRFVHISVSEQFDPLLTSCLILVSPNSLCGYP